MKLRDPDASALVDAYRAHTRPSPQARQRMASVLLEEKAETRRVWPWLVVGAVAAAAVVFWLVVARLGDPLGMTARSTPSTAADHVQPNATVRVASDGAQPDASHPEQPVHEAAPARPAALPPAPQTSRPVPARAPADRSSPSEAPDATATIEGAADVWLRIDAAERALAQGKPSRALVELDLHAREFPRADLRQERRALRVLALCALGKTAEGRGQQTAFLRDFPRSTYRPRVERACTP